MGEKEETGEHTSPGSEPFIRRKSVDSVILRLAAAGYRKITHFDWVMLLTEI